MAKVYERIDAELAEWISRQKVFFVATSPLSGDGMVNCSPKGMDTFRILDGHTVAYLDLTGSGIETVAHLNENGRIVVMMCAFEGAPKIVRLHGKGEVCPVGTEEFREMVGRFREYPGARSIIRIRVTRIGDSCGWGVPLYAFDGERDALTQWAGRKNEAELAAYREEANARSLDGLEGLGK